MLQKNNIIELLSKMTDDINLNVKKIKMAFGSINYKDSIKQSILHILVDDLYDEEKCFLAIKSLLKINLSPNLESKYKYNFIQLALYTGYSEEFILKIIEEALKYNLNVNHVDEDNDTIIHTAIYSDDYLGSIERIYELLCNNGFDSSLRCKEGRNLVEAMIFQKQYSKEQIKSFKNKFDLECFKSNEKKNTLNSYDSKEKVVDITELLSNQDISILEKYGNILNKKKYLVSPTIGREKEIKNLMVSLAQDKKRPLIVGESGVGKTSLLDELAFRIKTGTVPSFLQNKIILEVNPSDVVAGCRYVGMFEEHMTELMKICEKNDVIVFIDEIHTIYGIGSSSAKDNDMSSMLKHYIDRSNLKIIGTTTEKEYNEYFSSDALKRRFEKIIVNEPTDDILYKIIDKVINDYCLRNEIFFDNENLKNEIINIIIDATKKSSRVYNDIINNPDLSISIVDKAFAFAKVYDSEFIKVDHFIESFSYCNRIYEGVKKQVISKLKRLDKVEKTPQKVLKIDFNK